MEPLQACIEQDERIERKFNSCHPLTTTLRPSFSGKVSRAGITHFYLSSLLQSLFHFYVFRVVVWSMVLGSFAFWDFGCEKVLRYFRRVLKASFLYLFNYLTVRLI